MAPSSIFVFRKKSVLFGSQLENWWCTGGIFSTGKGWEHGIELSCWRRETPSVAMPPPNDPKFGFFGLRGSCVYSARTLAIKLGLSLSKSRKAVTSQVDPGPTSVGAGDGNGEHSNLFRQVL